MTAAAICSGVISTDANGAALCSSGWTSVAYETVVPFDPSQLDPGDLSFAFALGFGLLMGVWAMCKSVEVILRMIK